MIDRDGYGARVDEGDAKSGRERDEELWFDVIDGMIGMYHDECSAYTQVDVLFNGDHIPGMHVDGILTYMYFDSYISIPVCCFIYVSKTCF